MLKTNLEWIKKNVPGDLKIWKEMISEIDWKDFGKKQANKLRMDKERIQSEVRDFIALSPAEKWDRFINGERQLGRLYQKGSIAFTRREWKGVESTARDFQNWLILWADMIKMVMRDPMSIALGLFEYRWFSSYLASVAFFDRNTLGVRGICAACCTAAHIHVRSCLAACLLCLLIHFSEKLLSTFHHLLLSSFDICYLRICHLFCICSLRQ